MAWTTSFIHLILLYSIFSAFLGPLLGCPQHQKAALDEFRLTLEKNYLLDYPVTPHNDPGIGTWNSSTDCCLWVGVTCRSYPAFQQVVSLDLAFSARYSFLVSEDLAPIFLIQSLESLDISQNQIHGKIPGLGLANLTKLVRLKMNDNGFMGSVPAEIGNLTELQELVLSTNDLAGRFPIWIQKMGKLEILRLENNMLSGEIPAELFNLKLKELDLGENNLTLKPARISPKCMLYHLSLRSCNVSGRIPFWLSSQTNLTTLDLSNNKLKGNLPVWLAELEFESLFLSNNKLSGSLPPPLFQSQRLKALLLYGNNFSGELPDNIGEATYLLNLNLARNDFSGPLPTSITNLTNLQWLDLSRNEFSGHIPNFNYVPYVDLSYNRFSGDVPSSLGGVVLNLGRNELSGNLPMNPLWESLVHLDLRDNSITGEIPESFSQISSLQFLSLKNNSLTGRIPCQLSSLSQLQILDLSYNDLTGHIPPCFGNFSGMTEETSGGLTIIFIPGDQSSRLEHDLEVIWKDSVQNLPADRVVLYTLLDLSNNHLSGEIPDALGHLKSLKTLNISHNTLSGHIPTTFGGLKSLESLDMSNNNLSGHIPQTFAKLLNLTRLDVSSNNLTGRIPNGPQMDRFNDPSNYANNRGLCGEQIQVQCGEAPEQTKPEANESKETLFSWEMAGIGFPVGCISTVLVTYSLGFFSTAHQQLKPHRARRR